MRVERLLLAVWLVACRRPTPPPSEGPPRIVSLSPSTTEALFAVGAGPETIARSRYCDFPPAAASLPVVGGFVDGDAEAIVALRPTLVVGARGPAGPRLATRLEALGVATWFPSAESVDEVSALLRGLGARTGHAAGGEAAAKALEAELAALATPLAAAKKVRALLVFGTRPVVVAGAHTFPDELLARAGAVNVATGSGYPTLPAETLAALDPDVVLDAVMGGDEPRVGPSTPGLSGLRAVREGHVVALTDPVVLRPGPRLPAAVRVFAKALHPEVALPAASAPEMR